VRYTDPQAGTYSVNIAGTSIPEGPQEYFVVYYFLMDEVAITYPLDGDPLVPGRLELVHWEALGNNEPFELSYSLDDGNNWTVLDANIDPSARNYEWTPPAVATNKARLRIRRGVQTATSGRIHLIGQAQNLELLRVCEDDGTMLLNWEAVDGATAYEVRLLGDKYMEAVDTVDNPLVDLNLDPTQEHWIAVRAIGEDGLNGLQSLAINIQPSQFGNSCLLECDDQQDIGVRRIITPLTYTSGCLDNRLLITLELENKGDQAVSDPTASFKIDDEETITETVNGTVPAGGTLIYTFTLTPEITEGNHWLQTFASHPDDRATCNNSKSLNFDWQPGPQALPFREDFTGFSICRDLSTCGRSVCTITGSGWRNLNNITFDFTDWLVSNGTLYRGNFLPSTDHTSDQADGNFLMFSTSSACGSKNAILQSPCIDLTTAAKPTLEFWAFAGEAEDAEIAVEVSTDELDWSPIGTSLKRFDANEWTQHQISLEAYKGQTIYLRIIGIAGSATSYNLAIDDIQVFDANELSAPAFVASAQMVCPYEQVVLSDLSSGAIIERKWEITPTTFQFVGGSSAASNAPVIHFTQAGQYTVKLTSINNNGSRVSEIPNYITVGAGSPLPVQVDFEDWELCRKDLVCGLGCILSNGWRNALNGSEDQADWRVLSGTPSYSNYGPTVDHTTASASGKYLYVEPVNCEGQEAIMYSECLDLSNTEEPVVYWWQMSPDFRNSELHLDVLVDGQLIDDIIPPITGTPGSSVWTQQNADLSLFKGKSIILRFRAVTGLDIFARISIDDIDIYDKAKRPLPRMAIQNPEACIAYPVSLEDQSSDNTSSVQWRFEPSTYTFVNGTSANDRNVSVLFTQAGTYTAILTATNSAGGSEQRQEDIIQIGEGELLPYRQSFDSPRGCARSGACEITCPPMEGWTNAKNGTDDSGDWNIGRSNFGSIFAPPTDFSTRREGGYYANLNYKFGCGQMADLISPCIDLTNESDPFLSFAYYTGGDLGGSLKVDVYDNGQWEEILPLFSSNTKKWEQRQVSLKDYSGKIILVRFRGEAGNDYPSFIALDDVEFYNIDDAPVPSIEVSQEECIGAPVTLSNFSKGYVTQWKWEIEPNSFEFVGGTNDASQTPLVNFLNDGVYTITLNAINDAGTTSATTSMTIGQSIELPYENSFDAAPICTTFPDCDIQCNLTDGLRNATTDQNEWFVYNSRTFGLETGPTTDHTQGTPWGRYLYVPSLCSETDAVMSSPCIDLTTAQSAKMSFWYHMYGEAMGSLHIDLAANGQWSTDIVPPITGDQGDEWRYAEVSLNDYVGEHISLNFRALIGGITSDIAIDDLNIQVGTLSNNNLPDGQQLTVFPNPTNNRITLGWSVAIEEALDWQLYDHQGRLLKDGQFQTIGRTTAGLDLSDLPAGVYLLRIASDRWVTTEKVELIR
ncbi:MAG: PKD domain-containing protein, partial [Bacteroidota bacterium]